MRLRVDARSGSVVLTVPARASERKALQWAAGQRQWIEAALANVPAAAPIAVGQEIPLYGEPYRVEWNPEAPRVVKVEPGRILVGGPLEAGEARALLALKRP